MAIKYDPNYNPKREGQKLVGNAMVLLGIIVIVASVADGQEFYAIGIGFIVGGVIRLATLPSGKQENPKDDPPSKSSSEDQL